MSRTLLLTLLVSLALSACSKKEQVQADEQPAETTTATTEPTETASQESEQATTPTVSEEGTIAAPANVEAPHQVISAYNACSTVDTWDLIHTVIWCGFHDSKAPIAR